jgi:hypothetical protein
VVDAKPKRSPAETQRELERVPLLRQPRINTQRIAAGPDPAEPEDERLPQPAHRRQMQTAGGGAGQIVEVDPSSDPEGFERRPVSAGSGEDACVDGGRERAAVRGSRLVEVEVRDERPRRHLVRQKVMEHQHVCLLEHLRRLRPTGAE